MTSNSLLSLLKLAIREPDEATKRMLCDLIQRLLTKTRTRLNTNPSTSTAHPVDQDGEESPSHSEEVNLEEFSIQFLCIYSTQPHWRQVVSSPNRYGQTLAHISVTLGYFQLLQHLFKWEIDINTTDKMGLTALHYAYLFKQEECARFLIHSGANQFILDGLGRSPSDLNPSLGAVLHSIMDTKDSSSAREGHYCLPRPEYQFQNHEPNIGTSFLFQNGNPSPFETSPPLSSESPGSDLNHEGSVILSITQSQNQAIDCGHNPSTKIYKCSNAHCSFTSSRQAHVNDHYSGHHLDMSYKCDLW